MFCTRSASRTLHDELKQLSTELEKYTETKRSKTDNINMTGKTQVTEGHH